MLTVYLIHFVKKIMDVAHSVSNENIGSVAEQLISSIKNTISNKDLVNISFQSLIQNLRKNMPPKCVENWDSLSDDEQTKISEMGHFFCRIHLSANFAEEFNRILS